MNDAISCHAIYKKANHWQKTYCTGSVNTSCQEKVFKVADARRLSFHDYQLTDQSNYLLFCPSIYSCVVNEYVETMQELACEILELLGEGLGLGNSGVFSRLIRDNESDSLLRLNHYPPCHDKEDTRNGNSDKDLRSGRIGFGEHSDPQIITLLTSNGVGGLQILSRSSSDGAAWVPLPPDPNAFYIMVGDLLQAMTNGRLVSVRHRAMVNSYSSRLSMVYFGAPPLHEWISPLPEMITPQMPRCYKSFTWAEYKKAMYSLQLGHNRLDLFRKDKVEEHPWLVK